MTIATVDGVGLVEQTIGGPPIVLRLYQAGPASGAAYVDIDCTKIVGEVVTTYGRSQPDTRPAPGQVSLTVLRSAIPWLPTVGDLLVTMLTPEAMTFLGHPGTPGYQRFQGICTDPILTAATSSTPALVTLVAIGQRAALADMTWDPNWVDPFAPYGHGPADGMGDGDMVHQILAASGTHVWGVPGYLALGGDYPMLRDPDTTNVLAAVEAVSEASGGEVYEGPSSYAYRSQSYANTVAVTITLTADNVLNTPLTWTESRSGLVNDVEVPYGRAGDPVYPAGTYRLVDQLAVNRHGPGAVTLPPLHVNAANAQHRAEDIISRRGRPAWAIAELDVDLVRSVTPVQADKLLTATVLSRGTLSGIPDDGGPYATLDFTVEGWTERLSRDDWRMSVAVSDRRVTGPGPTWGDVPHTVTWATFNDRTRSWLGGRTWTPAV